MNTNAHTFTTTAAEGRNAGRDMVTCTCTCGYTVHTGAEWASMVTSAHQSHPTAAADFAAANPVR